MPIKANRALLAVAFDGTLDTATFQKDPNFGFDVPVEMPGIETDLPHPCDTWKDQDANDSQATKLVGMFKHNFEQFMPCVAKGVNAVAIG